MSDTVQAIQLFVKLLYTTMPRAEYDALPDRSALTGLPIDGVTYRDPGHPCVIFCCRAGINWRAYSYTALQPQLLED